MALFVFARPVVSLHLLSPSLRYLLIMWACFSAAVISCWCDLTLPLLTVDYSFVLFYQPSSLIHISSNPSIFSLFPSSWITIIPKIPYFFLCLLPKSFNLLIPILHPQSPCPSSPFCPPPSLPPSRSAPPSLQDFWQVWGVCRAACVHLNEKNCTL